MSEFSRREYLKYTSAGIGSAGIASFAGCSSDGDDGNGGSGGDGGDDGNGGDTDGGNGGDGGDESAQPTDLDYIISEDALDMVPLQAGTESGAWRNNAINLRTEVAGYGKFSRALTTGDSVLGGTNQAIFTNARERGEDLVVFGSDLIQLNAMFVRPDSDIESPADLEGRKVGVPFWESGTTMGMRALIIDEYGIDLREDTEATASDPPVLWNLLVEQEELDAIVEFTGQTIKGWANDDLVRTIFDPREYWYDRTGNQLEVTYFTARRSWLEDNYDVAHNFIQGWGEALQNIADDPQDSYERFGRLAGLSSEEEIQVAVEQFEEGNLHHTDPSVWDEEYVQSQFDFLQVLADTGVIESAPSMEDAAITYEELQSQAEDA